jgi:hypothetical protein
MDKRGSPEFSRSALVRDDPFMTVYGEIHALGNFDAGDGGLA